MKKEYIILPLFIVLILFIFRSWFLPGIISSGDLRIFYSSSFGDYYLQPFAWDWQQANGFGGVLSPYAWTYYNLAIPLIIGAMFNFSWEIIEKIFFLIPFLVLGFLSSLYFFETLFPKKTFYFLGPLFYLFNTYI